MRARLILAAAGGVLIATMALAPPAEAGYGWTFGAGFHVGGAHFQIGFQPPGAGYGPGAFFLTSHRLHYPGLSCHGACFRRGGGYYHHASCPLLGFHFRRGGHSVGHFLGHYSPYRGHGYRGHGYGGYGYRGHGPGYYRYPGRSHGHGRYYDGYRGHYRRYGDHRHPGYRYRDHHYRGDRHRGYRDDSRYRHDRRGYRDWDDDSDSDSDRRRGRRRGYRGRD